MFSRFCKLCHGNIDVSVINLRKYGISSILLQEQSQAETKVSEKEKRVPLIVCKRPEFNFYKGKTYSKFETIPLASQGWHNSKSSGDHFTILPDYDIEDEYEDVPEEQEGFKQFCIHPKLIENLSDNNINAPTVIQTLGIPKILAGQNSVLSAETGCGKTIAYLLPILDQILKWKKLQGKSERRPNSPYGLIITPSRELAEQIGKEASKLVKDLGIDLKVLTGGRTKRISSNPSVRNIDLLIGSFGVVSKMTSSKIYKLNWVRHVVLDEAHALFDVTFDEKLEVFLQRIHFERDLRDDDFSFPTGSQLTLVSATQPSEMPEYLRNVIDMSSLIDVRTNNFHRIMVPQKFMRVVGVDKPMVLLKLVKRKAMKKHPFIVFSNDSSTCDWISLYFNEFGIRTIGLNGEMPMRVRSGKFASFLNGEYTVLSATNAGARGLDTFNVNDVINYDFPMQTAEYIHRCGRTGRIGTKGECKVTNLISRRLEIELAQKIERTTRRMRPLPIFDMVEEDAKRKEKAKSPKIVKTRKNRSKSQRTDGRTKKNTRKNRERELDAEESSA